MPRFLIDVNLPYYLKTWNNVQFIHQYDIDSKATDKNIWDYAKEYNLTIITKDSDFSNRILVTSPPPKIIHIKIGNMKMKTFHQFIQDSWIKVSLLSETHKLVNVYHDKIEGIN